MGIQSGTQCNTYIGPTAEDFYDQFGVGTTPDKLSAIDLGGASLAAIQVLTQKILMLEEKIKVLEKTSDSKKQKKKKKKKKRRSSLLF